MNINSPMQSGSHPTTRWGGVSRRAGGVLLSGLLLVASSDLARAANIAFVSDYNDPSVGFFPPGSGFTDSGFVTLLQNAGHNVIRYNPPNANATLLTQAELDALNTNDLVIISRCVNSGAFQTGQGNQWNVAITKPLMDLSAYHARNNRLGWFAGNEGLDTTPAKLTPFNLSNPVTDFLFGGVAMSGTNTAITYDEPMDRNSTPIPSAPVAGGIVHAGGTYAPENGTAVTNGNFIVGFPAGTAVRGGVDILGGYRMFFSAGSRESATAPNSIPLYTARENLTSTGEDIFMRAVAVALNRGVAPSTNAGPAGIAIQPVDQTISQAGPASFNIAVTGAAPRLVQWQRSDGAGGFTNIPGAVSAFPKATYSLPSVPLTDSGAQFQVVVSNSLNIVTSDVVTLTVTADMQPPVALSAGSIDGNTIVVCFSEALDPNVSVDGGNYQINSGAGPSISTITLRPDGKSVTMTLSGPIANTATLDVFNPTDVYGNVSSEVSSLIVTNLGLTGVDVGALNPPGSNFTCDSNSIAVTGGGLDLGGTAEFLRFVYRTASGDFDARARVVSFVGTNDHFETTAKAILAVRETTANNSPAVNAFVTPLAPGDDTVSSTYRTTAGGATTALGPTLVGTGLATSNAWLRILRVGNQFTTYRGTNGSNWVAFGNVTIALANTVNVGVGVVSHRNGKVVTGTFSDFKISPVLLPVVLTNWNSGGGNFSASFNTQNGFSYAVEYRDVINTGSWTTLTNIVGNGTTATFTDVGLSSPTGNRFYRVSAQ